MTTLKSPPPTQLTLDNLDSNSWLDDGIAQASDVLTPFQEFQSALNSANDQLTVSDADTSYGNLDEKLLAHTGIENNNLDAGAGQLQKQLSLTASLYNLIAVLLANSDLPVSGIDVAAAPFNSRFVVGANNSLTVAASSAILEDKTISGTAGETLAELDFVYLNSSDGEWYKVDADTLSSFDKLVGYVTESGGISNSASGDITLRGKVSGFVGLTAGQPVFAGTTAGQIVQTKPDPADGGSQLTIFQAGEAISATEILLLTPPPMQIMRRATLAHNATLTLQHPADPGTLRRAFAYLHTQLPSEAVIEHDVAHQDTDLAFRSQIIQSYSANLCINDIGDLITASSQTYGVATRAFDANPATVWGTNTVAPPHWIEYEFNTARTIRRYTLQAASNFVTRTPGTWELQYWDGGAYLTADSRAAISWTAGQVQSFDVDSPHSATRWRLYISDNSGNNDNTRIAEIEMMQANLTNAHHSLAQVFTLAHETLIEGIHLWLKKHNHPAGSLIIRIESLNATLPSGAPAHPSAEETLAESSLATTYTETTVNFATPFTLPAGDYALVIYGNRAFSETDYVDFAADNSSPPYGGLLSWDGSTWLSTGMDLIFAVYQTPQSFSEPARIGPWGSPMTDVEVRFDDGADSNPDTHTTFRNTLGETVDLTCILEL